MDMNWLSLLIFHLFLQDDTVLVSECLLNGRFIHIILDIHKTVKGSHYESHIHFC